MTLQIKEKLTYNGKEYELHTEPLKSYLYEHPIKRPSCTHSFCTACLRGYVGHWAIEDDKLYLVELDSFNGEPIRNIMNDLFPGQQKVLAEWFSGTIHTVSNKMYIHCEFKIEKGHLVKVLEKENEYLTNLNFEEL